MKKIFFVLAMLLCGLAASAQVSTHYFESKDAFLSFPALKQADVKEMALKKMPQFDVRQLLEEDRAVEGLDVPFRFGHDFEVDYTLSNGKWANQGGKRIWNMRVSSPGAYSLNFIFSELNLIPGAELYIYNPEGSMVYGPVTAEQNISKGTFLTDLIAGDEVIIQLIEPDISKESSSLRISRVIHGYKNMFPFQGGMALRAAGACNNDIACYSNWTLESDGVALILLSNGASICTGSLLNNTAQNYKPYFLTAFHCIDRNPRDSILSNAEIAIAENWMFRFNYKKATCNGGTTATTTTYNQAHFRAAYANTDFALMELKNAVTHSNAVFLGWDRTSTASTLGTGIHHPSGDVMKISFDNDNLTETSYKNNTGTNYWRVDWNNGVTEGGSSGSPLFNANKRVTGQLRGGYSSCSSSDMRDWYGCLYRSWTGGGTNDTRLSNWLNPNGSSATFINSIELPDPPVIASITGPTYTPNMQYASYHANLQTGSTATNYQWTLNPQKSNNLYGVNTSTLDIAFYEAGTYQVVCKAYNAGGWGDYCVLGITVYNTVSYSAAVTNGSKVVTVTLLQGNVTQSSTQTVDYTLTNATSGAAVASGKMPASGGTLNFSHVPAGIYILRIDTGSGTPETFKIILR